MWVALTNVITVRRATAYVLDRTAANSTMTWSRQPVRESVVLFRVWGDGTAGTGTMTVTGTSGGVAATETVVTTGPATYRTTRAWTALAGLTTSGLADEAAIPTVDAQATGLSGSPQETHYTVVTGWPASIMVGGAGGSLQQGGSWPNQVAAGRTQKADAEAILAWDETWAPREGDLLDDDAGRTWQIVGRPRIAGTVAIRHWSCRLREHEALAP